MSNVENITKVYLLNVPLEKDYKNTLYFASKDIQYNYFESKIKHRFTDFSYQRKDNTIRLPMQFDSIINCNYVMYKNQYYSNKWFYAFITNVEYKSDDVTIITIETDVIQTWMFDITIKPSFIDREHVDNDTIGLHTVPENLEMGEYVCNYKTSYAGLTNLKIVMGVTESPRTFTISSNTINSSDWLPSGMYNNYGTFSSLSYKAFPLTVDDMNNLSFVIQGYAKAGKTDAIVSIFLVPSELCETYEGTHPDANTINMTVYSVKGDSLIHNYLSTEFSVDRNLDVLDGYKPKNNKLYCYPYKYLNVSNNNGASAIYQWEHFNDEKPLFDIIGTLTPGCSIRLIPKNYKKCAINDEEGLNLGKFPICNWVSDEYTNWLTQNGVNIGINLISGLGQIIGGTGIALASGGLGMAVGGTSIVSGVNTIANQLAQVHQMSFTPPQARGNTNNGDIISASGKNTFTFYGMTIKDEYIKIIDEYFHMYGYKCNRVKTPNTNHRAQFWYTKTIDANIIGSIPQTDLQKIKDCYNSGITFWRYESYMFNYSVNNLISI